MVILEKTADVAFQYRRKLGKAFFCLFSIFFFRRQETVFCAFILRLTKHIQFMKVFSLQLIFWQKKCILRQTKTGPLKSRRKNAEKRMSCRNVCKIHFCKLLCLCSKTYQNHYQLPFQVTFLNVIDTYFYEARIFIFNCSNRLRK